MTTWDYRIARHGDGPWMLCEVYYDDEGRVKAWTDAVCFVADPDEDPQVVVQDLARALGTALRHGPVELRVGERGHGRTRMKEDAALRVVSALAGLPDWAVPEACAGCGEPIPPLAADEEIQLRHAWEMHCVRVVRTRECERSNPPHEPLSCLAKGPALWCPSCATKLEAAGVEVREPEEPT